MMAQSKILPGIALGISMTFVGFLAGGLLGALFASGMGWDRLADTLGGVMLGTLIGFGTGIFLAVRLPVAQVKRAAWIAFLVALLLVGVLYVRQRMQNRSEAGAVESPAVERVDGGSGYASQRSNSAHPRAA